ncbi:hypothetical protein EOE18_11065 [Novosphingobium umbonatum]|uniref:Uncharacterized protein n=1 Tax=Novosphingobium umbonatum TaxID=1908524 RepID=A0A3S2Y6J7_9SPHN|nr:hypothetical protein [Novosphingobium umbonatum]RVU04688.1 hypothetical protein EOE18_11065 [Novosphingobium umbonatum]
MSTDPDIRYGAFPLARFPVGLASFLVQYRVYRLNYGQEMSDLPRLLGSGRVFAVILAESALSNNRLDLPIIRWLEREVLGLSRKMCLKIINEKYGCGVIRVACDVGVSSAKEALMSALFIPVRLQA